MFVVFASAIIQNHMQPRNCTWSKLLFTYLLTPWCSVLLEKLTGLQLIKKFPAFHGTRRFITALTSVRHLSLSWAGPIQSIYPHPTSWRSILILSAHLRLGLPSGLLHSGFPTKTLYIPLSSPIRATCPLFVTKTLLLARGRVRPSGNCKHYLRWRYRNSSCGQQNIFWLTVPANSVTRLAVF